MSHSDSETESNILPNEVCEQQCDELAAVTQPDLALAKLHLGSVECDLKVKYVNKILACGNKATVDKHQ